MESVILAGIACTTGLLVMVWLASIVVYLSSAAKRHNREVGR